MLQYTAVRIRLETRFVAGTASETSRPQPQWRPDIPAAIPLTTQVQVWLGHHSPAFTLATYVHLLPNDLSDPDFLDGLTAPSEPDRGDSARSLQRSLRRAPGYGGAPLRSEWNARLRKPRATTRGNRLFKRCSVVNARL